MRRVLFIVTLLGIATLPLTAGSIRFGTSTAASSSMGSGVQGQASDAIRDAPPDLTSYTRNAISADIAVRRNQAAFALTAPGIRVIDTVINNTNTNLTNTDTFNDGEPSIAINPANPKELVITAFSGSWGANAPLWRSSDRGQTWTKEFTIPAPPMVASATNCPCDQDVDFDRNNNLAGTFLTFSPTDDYSGLTNNPDSIPSWNWLLSGGAAQKTNSSGAGNIDQPWLLVDRDTAVAGQDNTYVAYDDFNGAPDMHVAVSLGSDPPSFVRDNISGFSGGGGINPGHRLAVDPNNGFVYSLFQQRAGGGAGGSQNINYMLNRSSDGGQTWTLNGSTTGIQVANQDSTQPTPKFGTCNALLGGVLHAAVDPTTDDLYYVYGNRDSGTGNNRLSIVRITNDGMGGMTVGAPVFVTGQVQAALPSVAVASDGTVGVLYDTFDGMTSGFPQFTAHFAISTDHGASFSDNTLLTFLSVANDNGNARQRVLGDYQQVKADGKTFYGVFTGNGAALGRPFSNHDPIFFSVDLCVIGQPADVVASNTTGQCGAVVNYPAPATSGDCGTVICSPASGSFFPVGTTTVTCSSPGVQSVTFKVTVKD
ncbi:MAG: sialidase family protein, partial [Blastocatellia bacterium]